MPLTVFNATVAVAAPLIATINAAAVRNRFHMLHRNEGGFSSFIGCRLSVEAAHGGVTDLRARRSGALRSSSVANGPARSPW